MPKHRYLRFSIPILALILWTGVGCASGPGGRGGRGAPPEGIRARQVGADSLRARMAEPVRVRRPAADLAESLVRARRENRRILIIWNDSPSERGEELRHLLLEDSSLAGKVHWEYELVWADLDSLDRDPGLRRYFEAEPSFDDAGLPRMTVLDGEGAFVARGHLAPLSPRDEDGPDLDADRRQVFAFLLDHQTPWPDAVAGLDAARSEAERTDRLVFVYFTEPLCDWCEFLAGWIERPAVAPVWDRVFVTFRVDIGRSANGDVLWQRYIGRGGGRRGTFGIGLPWFVITRPSGRVVGDSHLMPEDQNVGFPWTDEEIVAFADFLSRRIEQITDEERIALMTDLRILHEEMRARGEAPPEELQGPGRPPGRGRPIPPEGRFAP